MNLSTQINCNFFYQIIVYLISAIALLGDSGAPIEDFNSIKILNDTLSEPVFSEKDYYGLWSTNVNDNPIYLVIKRNHIIKYFLRNGENTNIYSSKWEINNTGILEIENILSNKVTFDLANNAINYSNLEGEELNLSQEKKSDISKLDDSILGSWARPPDFQKIDYKNITSNYYGIWKTIDNTDNTFFEVRDDRKVYLINADKEKNEKLPVLYGEWSKHGKQLHILWENGEYSIVDNTAENSVKLYNFDPGEIIKEDKLEYQIISSEIEIDELDSFKRYQQVIDKKINISLKHYSQKDLMKFFHGEWLILGLKDPNTFDILKFGRFGSINISSDKKIKGNWYPSPKNTTLYLGNGLRMKFKPLGTGLIFLLYEANRPLDGYPSKVLNSTPVNFKKLKEFNLEKSYTLEFLNQFPQFNDYPSFNFLGRSFANHPLLAKDPDPWWWPLWSDKISENTKYMTQNSTNPNLEKKTNLKIPANNVNINANKNIQIKNAWSWPF